MKNEEYSQFESHCRAAGLRVTPQRLAVYKELMNSKAHPSAVSVWQEVRNVYPNISLDTVNRTLLTLAEIGAAFVVEGSGDVKRFDGNCDGHQHFKCVKCKRIIDFDHQPFKDIEVPGELAQKYQVIRKTVYVEGVCDRCQEQ